MPNTISISGTRLQALQLLRVLSEEAVTQLAIERYALPDIAHWVRQLEAVVSVDGSPTDTGE